MKPFDIELAKQGKPVCTRDGRPVRILCYDFITPEIYPIVALVKLASGQETIVCYKENGSQYLGKKERCTDLMMASEKKEGWINIYHGSGIPYPEDHIYDSKEKAFEMRDIDSYVDTILIKWEE